jgi:protein-tyrosine phosphatase
MNPRKILFVCFGNLCRSPMAAGFFNAAARGRPLAAESAGVGAADGAPPSLLAVLEMKRRGIDIAFHRARSMISIDPTAFETVVALDREVAALFAAAYPDFRGLRIWDVPDPYGASAGRYRQAADLILVHVDELVRELLTPGA